MLLKKTTFLQHKKSLSLYLESKLEDYLEKVGAEVPEESFSWGKNSKNGQVKTQFFRDINFSINYFSFCYR